MLSLVNSDDEKDSYAARQQVINKIISVGLNSLSGHLSSAMASSEERRLVDAFMSQSFDKILPCWPMLDDKVKFYIFKFHIEDFTQYMTQKQERKDNV